MKGCYYSWGVLFDSNILFQDSLYLTWYCLFVVTAFNTKDYFLANVYYFSIHSEMACFYTYK